MLVAAMAVFVLTECGGAAARVDPAIAEAGRRAEVAEMSALVPPPGVNCPFDDAGWAAVQQHARALITSALAEPERGRILNALLRPAMRKVCWLAGGVDLYKPSGTRVNGDHATLTARVGIWNRIRTVEQPPAEPHNQIDATFALVRSGTTWLVSDIKWDFVPAHGP